jgi:dipeptidyl aminopeptidase/acylaminoacyl peptidase
MTRVGVALLAIAGSGLLVAAAPADGTLLSMTRRASMRAYELLDNVGRGEFPKAVYEHARLQRDFDVVDIRYASTGDGGASVEGVLIRPVKVDGRQWPVIIYNRGGTGDVGRIDDLTIADLYLLAKEGFVVIASDYRFHGARAKHDEWGGADVNDVLSLVRLAQSLEIVDRNRLFMLGVERGGMMTYLALKHGVPVKAAAVIAGPSDLEALGQDRPELLRGDDLYGGWMRVWPDFTHRSAEHYRARSVAYWADRIQVPVLILHAKDDRLIPLGQSLRAALALKEAGVRHDVQVYLNDSHSLSRHRDDRNQRIVDWFRDAISETRSQGAHRVSR